MNIIYLAIPVFVLLLVAEILYFRQIHYHGHEFKDSISSLGMGIGNVLIGILTKVIVFGTYMLLYELRIFELGSSWWVWILLFFFEDFSYYWFHRFSHEIRFFWASHVVHHSSRKYNLATALRQTWTGQISGSFVFWLWLPLVGFHPLMIITMQAISLIYQFWIHTESIVRLPGWFEYIFNTPSHHRVHHSSESQYLDRNHAGILIIWDRIFGTFVPERKGQFPIYGLTENIKSYNPLNIAFHEWRSMIKDLKIAKSRKEVTNYIFGPPGWKPGDHSKTAQYIRNQMKKAH